MKSVKELRAMNEEALKNRLAEMRKELMKYNSQISVGTTPKSPGAVRRAKRSVARILTLINERRMKTKA